MRLLVAGVDPLDEPFFANLLSHSSAIFTTDAREALENTEAVIIAVGTPHLHDGSADLSALDEAADAVAANAPRATVFVRSTVPVGTADRLQGGVLRDATVISNPEFLSEGAALSGALRPARIVAGGPGHARSTVEKLYGPVLRQDYPPVGDLAPLDRPVPLCWMDPRSAELTKYAANAFLATKISYVNEIANVAAVVGADIRAITHALGLDPRIAPAFLRPGIGWGGACFPKDVRALAAFANDEGYDFTLLRAVIDQNNRQLLRLYSMIENEFDGRERVRIGLLGLAFKSQTADCRESPAVALAKLMVWRGWEVVAYDPAVRFRPSELPDQVTLVQSLSAAASGADALVVATEWPEFAEADLSQIRTRMQGDVIFDGRCLIDPELCARAGLRYLGICAAPAKQRTQAQAADLATSWTSGG